MLGVSVYLLVPVAFIGGVISFLSPCTAVILPTFFANTFKERTNLLRATLLFFAGLVTLYIPLGLSTTFISKLIFTHRNLLRLLLGTAFVVWGTLLLLGKSTPLPNLSSVVSSRLPARLQDKILLSSFGMGLLSGLGSTPCAGPVLGVILTLAASTQSFTLGTFLMLVYTSGLFLPLFALAFLFDKTPKVQKILQGKVFHLKLLNHHWQLHSTNLLAALLLLTLGTLFLSRGNTLALTPWYKQGTLLNRIFDIQEKLVQLLY